MNVPTNGTAKRETCKTPRNGWIYPHTTNSPYTNYWSALYSPTQPPSGAIHRLLTTVNFKFFNLNVLESTVINPNAPPSHTYTLLLTSNPFTSLFTVWLTNFSIAVQLTLTLSFVKYGATLYLISTGSIENIYTNRQNISCCNSPPSGRSVFIIVTIFHCWNINMSCSYLHEYTKC